MRRTLLDAFSSFPPAGARPGAGLPISRSVISQHLRVLSGADLVTEERVGRERRYRLHPEPLHEVDRWVSHYERFWRGRLQTLRRVLDERP